jgi:exodeoxyribonuclease 7 large subunit
LDGLSPLKVLARGYSIAEDVKGHAIVSVKQVKTGDTIKTKVADGEITSRVC